MLGTQESLDKKIGVLVQAYSESGKPDTEYRPQCHDLVGALTLPMCHVNACLKSGAGARWQRHTALVPALEGRGPWISVSSSPSWSTNEEQPRLQRETLSAEQNKTK